MTDTYLVTGLTVSTNEGYVIADLDRYLPPVQEVCLLLDDLEAEMTFLGATFHGPAFVRLEPVYEPAATLLRLREISKREHISGLLIVRGS